VFDLILFAGFFFSTF